MESNPPTLADRESILAFWMLAPTCIIVLVIIIFPVIWNIWLSMKSVSLGGLRDAPLFTLDFTGENYRTILKDPYFTSGLVTTLVYAILGSGLSVFLGLIAALLVHGEFPGKSLVRGILITPYIAPVVAVAFVWGFILDPQMGIVNWFLTEKGGLTQPIAFLSQRWWNVSVLGLNLRIPMALSSVILFEGWRYFPFAFLFILARLQAIPDEWYSSAKVDGATPFQQFRHITFPQLTVVLGNLFLFRFIWTFNKFDDIFLLTRGQAGTGVLTIKVYDYTFGQFNIGAGSALAMVLFVVLAILLIIYFRFIVKETESIL
jgi:multiple sugar transport system permease protein